MVHIGKYFSFHSNRIALEKLIKDVKKHFKPKKSSLLYRNFSNKILYFKQNLDYYIMVLRTILVNI